MQKLEFTKSTNICGIFSTVRLGSEWGERTQPGEDGEFVTLHLVDAQGASLGTAQAVGCWVGRLVELPAQAIECHQDPIQRTWSGIAEILAGTHPDEEITYDTIVTVLQLKHTGGLVKLAGAGDLASLNGRQG